MVTEVGASGGAGVKAGPCVGSEVGPAMVASGVCDGSTTASGVAVAVAKFWSEPEEPLLAISSTSALSVMSIASRVNADVRIVTLFVKLAALSCSSHPRRFSNGNDVIPVLFSRIWLFY